MLRRGTGRREFLKGTAFAALAGVFGGCRTFCGAGDGLAVNGLRVGVQMWSVDKLWKLEPAAAFRRLKALGYDGVQSFKFLAMDWDELEKMLDGEGLQIVDMPFYMKNTKPGEFEKFVDFCHRFKIDFAYEPYATYPTAWEWLSHADELAELRGKFSDAGLRLGYHNHQHEYKQHFEGQTPFEFLADAGLDFELDVGHATLANENPVRWLERLRGCVPSIHAKPGGGRALGDADDRNDWPAIFRAARAAGTKWAIVECETRRDTFEDVERSAAFLKGLAG